MATYPQLFQQNVREAGREGREVGSEETAEGSFFGKKPAAAHSTNRYHRELLHK
jgi:hypothetical protein